ncbi:TrbI/VirB10 family protein [Burkholderia gladioli]|uniref:TrbI/VirB10 family protein n=1 Tax=Burkholderia gladioli TaxID=28095 RepID=UPI0016419B2F|nr:TrbI/VirB10 family protein [Burkholderia gladioli]
MSTPHSPIESTAKGRPSRRLLVWLIAVLIVIGAGLVVAVYVGSPTPQQTEDKTKEKQREALAKTAAGTPADVDRAATDQTEQVRAKREAEEAKKKYDQLLASMKGGEAASGATVPSATGLLTGQQLNNYQRDRDNAQLTAEEARDDIKAWRISADISQLGQAGGTNSTEGAAGLPSAAELAKSGAQQANAARDQSAALLSALKSGAGSAGSGGMTAWSSSVANTHIPDPATPQLAVSPNTVHQGTAIPLVADREVVSDIPGTLEAHVTEDVYDTIDSSRKVIPMGTRVIGPYNSDVIPGQNRLQGGFTRMIFPNGNSIDLGGSEMSDRLGQGGLGGDVNYHLFRSLALQFAVAGIAKVTKIDNGGGSGVSLYGGSTTSTAGQILSNTVQNFNQQFINTKPTITVPFGTPFTVTLSRDLILPPAITMTAPSFKDDQP